MIDVPILALISWGCEAVIRIDLGVFAIGIPEDFRTGVEDVMLLSILCGEITVGSSKEGLDAGDEAGFAETGWLWTGRAWRAMMGGRGRPDGVILC